MGSIVLRVIATIVAIVGWRVVNTLLNRGSTIIASELAGKQFENSNVSYGVSQFAHYFTGTGLPLILFIVVFVVIWWKYVKQGWAAITSMVMISTVLFGAVPSQAYYDKQDWAEVYFVLPNESAFFIPDVGANKDSQVQFGSEQYLRENKIAAKRFTIPHVKLEDSGLLSNYYVPAGRLVIVDRTPYNREWVSAVDRGTSDKNQGFPCQSKEGLNIAVGIAIGASLLEDNAPKYLYRFGIKPPDGDRTKPEVIFTSVLHSRSLTEAMDGVVRNKIQSLVCAEVSKRTFDEANMQAAAMMAQIKTDVEAYLTSVGITLDFVGWADTFGFDPAIQKAVNDKYVAETLGPVMPVLQELADIRMKEGLGAGLAKRLPSTVLAPPDTLSGLMGLLGGKPLAAHQAGGIEK